VKNFQPEKADHSVSSPAQSVVMFVHFPIGYYLVNNQEYFRKSARTPFASETGPRNREHTENASISGLARPWKTGAIAARADAPLRASRRFIFISSQNHLYHRERSGRRGNAPI